MENLQQFTEKILQNELAKIDTLKQQIDEANQIKVQTAESHFEQLVVESKQKIDNTVRLNHHINVMQIENKARNQVLKERQVALLSLFDTAKKELTQLDQTHFEQLFQGAVCQLDATKSYIVTFGEYTNFDVALPNFITKSDDVVAGEYGFLFEQNGVVYNYLYDTVLSDVKENYLGELFKVLTQ